jgi:Sec-independent protein translocase protein TatA
MEFLGIGWLELFAIIIIILLVAGPKDIERGARGLGRLINRLNRSPSYQAIRRASTELRNLPQRLAREANLEELKALTQEVQQVKEEVQQVRQEIKENTQNIAGPGKSFQAWVKELPAPETAPPAEPQAPATPAPNGPTPAADPAAPDAK